MAGLPYLTVCAGRYGSTKREPKSRQPGDMLKARYILGLLAIFNLATASDGSAQSTGLPSTVVAGPSVDWDAQLTDAMNLISQKEWPRALAGLRAIVDSNTFSSLPIDFQYRALSVTSRVSIHHGPPNLGYAYLARVIAMPQAGYEDWGERLQEADKTLNEAEMVATLTLMMQRWPDRTARLNPDYIQRVVNEARHLSHGAALPLLQALYDAHWRLQWEIEPSDAWRDLTQILLDKGRIAEAREVAGHVSDVYVLIAMRADRRFDDVTAADPAQFDIEAANEREFRARQAAADKMPKSLELKTRVIESLLYEQHYEAALAASDAILLDIRSTNFPERLYADYVDRRSWFLGIRATALKRVGRWDEAVAQLSAASRLNEKYTGNVDEVINLGALYCELERPREALVAVGDLVARTSPFGAMQLELVRLEAAEQLGDTGQVARSLDYMRVHRVEAMSTYVESLLVVNQLDRAARVLIAQLLDADQRPAALLSVQNFAPSPGTRWDMMLEGRSRTLIARPDVQAAIKEVGRVESYRVEQQ